MPLTSKDVFSQNIDIVSFYRFNKINEICWCLLLNDLQFYLA